jgi:hypothetical protein
MPSSPHDITPIGHFEQFPNDCFLELLRKRNPICPRDLSLPNLFELPQPPEAKELYFALCRNLSHFPAESDSSSNRWTVANYEFPETSQLDGIAVLGQMLNQGVFQTRDEDAHQELSLPLCGQAQCRLNPQYQLPTAFPG